ncbi:MAG: GNAT family N-acetyltransferase [Chitinophagaceae bacterium]|nr:GNAT family N-acetyltransferase [Chitinophagaceae bacterium]
MLHFLRTNSSSTDFIHLVQLLDADLAERDGADHSFYAQFNKITMIQHAIVAYEQEVPVACGAFKAFDAESAEIKRMYVLPQHRNKGIAAAVLQQLEQWAKEEGYTSTVLETGMKQPEAIHLYQKSGYLRIPNYGQYVGVENSVCMKKEL